MRTEREGLQTWHGNGAALSSASSVPGQRLPGRTLRVKFICCRGGEGNFPENGFMKDQRAGSGSSYLDGIFHIPEKTKTLSLPFPALKAPHNLGASGGGKNFLKKVYAASFTGTVLHHRGSSTSHVPLRPLNHGATLGDAGPTGIYSAAAPLLPRRKVRC